MVLKELILHLIQKKKKKNVASYCFVQRKGFSLYNKFVFELRRRQSRVCSLASMCVTWNCSRAASRSFLEASASVGTTRMLGSRQNAMHNHYSNDEILRNGNSTSVRARLHLALLRFTRDACDRYRRESFGKIRRQLTADFSSKKKKVERNSNVHVNVFKRDKKAKQNGSLLLQNLKIVTNKIRNARRVEKKKNNFKKFSRFQCGIFQSKLHKVRSSLIDNTKETISPNDIFLTSY